MATSAPPRTLPPNVLFGAVAAGVTAGVVLALLAHPFWGLGVAGTSLEGAATGRLLLPARSAGLLVVRSRMIDVVTVAALGTLILVLAFLLH